MSEHLDLLSPDGQPWHPTASQLAPGTAGDVTRADVQEHVTGCLRCRVQSARVEAAGRQRATGSALTALRASSPELPERLMTALRHAASRDTAEPAAGQLWRAGGGATGRPPGTALLVWIRRVHGTTAAVLPVVLDTDMADEDTLLVDPAASPLGTDLAVLTSVDVDIRVEALTTLIGPLPIDADVAAVRRRDTGPDAPHTGTPIARVDDQRIEFRQVVSELLHSLGEDPPDEDLDEDANPLALLDALRDLSYYEHGLRVESVERPEPTYTGDDHVLHPIAVVHHLSACVLVVAISGPSPVAALGGPHVARACAPLQHAFPEADSIAVCAVSPDWLSLMLGFGDTTTAIGTPSGRPAPARAPGEPLDLVTALRKHFDGARGIWDDTAPVRFDDVPSALHQAGQVAKDAARRAVDAVRREGGRAVIPSKRDGYATVDVTTVAAVETMMNSALAGADPGDVVDELLEGPS